MLLESKQNPNFSHFLLYPHVEIIELINSLSSLVVLGLSGDRNPPWFLLRRHSSSVVASGFAAVVVAAISVAGIRKSFGFMRLLQQVQEFRAVSEDDNKGNDDVCLGSVHHNDDKVKHITYRRGNHNSSFMADQEEPITNSGSSSKDYINNNGDNTNTNSNNNTNNQDDMRQEGWLQLSIGRRTGEVRPDEKTSLDRGQDHGGDDHPLADQMARREDSMLELNLFSGSSSRFPPQEEVGPTTLPFSNTSFRIRESLLHQYHNPQGGGMMNPVVFPTGHEEMMGSWTAFRSPFAPQNLTTSSLMMPLMAPYFPRSTFQSQLMGTSSYSDVMAGPSSSFRVIDPPRRPHAGIWFILQASQNQAREPYLPQIPKSYLRIKDGRMTVRLLMKYLVNKLRLEHESEIEIRCRGQNLEPVLTLQHVRDTIWRSSRRDISPSHNITLLPNSSTSDHLMVLHYGRSLS